MLDINLNNWNLKTKNIIVFTSLLTIVVLCTILIFTFYSKLKTIEAQEDLSQNNILLNYKIGALAEVINSDNKDDILKAKYDLKSNFEDLDSALGVLQKGGMYDYHGETIYLPPFNDEKVQNLLSDMRDEYQTEKKNAEILIEENKYLDVRDSNNIENRILNAKFTFALDTIQSNLISNNLTGKFQLLNQLIFERTKNSKNQFSFLIPILGGIECMLILLAFVFLERFIIVPVSQFASQAQNLGNDNEFYYLEYDGKDELSQIQKGINTLISEIKEASNFTHHIIQGEFDQNISIRRNSENDLGNSLSKMRDSLKKGHEEDSQREWINKGINLFVEILRDGNQSLQLLTDNILKNLVRYINANQATLFLKKTGPDKEEYLELISCYAWEKKRYVEKIFKKKEGLVGQAWAEGQIKFMTEIPQNYTNITSGLGDSNPNAIMILPLISNNIIYGILELASFHPFQEREINFIKNVSENIAATLANTIVSEETRKLLQQSQEQTEIMRSQEEEMRQNLEEIIATQEEVERKFINYEQRINELESELAELKAKQTI